MPRLIPIIFLTLAAAAARAGVPDDLAEAVRKVGADYGRWAYNQRTASFDRHGKPDHETVARFDPSKPYDQQWTLLSRDGHAATPTEVAKHRRDMAKRERNRRTLGELLELEHASRFGETETAIIYEIPLRDEENTRLPPEKFQVLARVGRQSRAFESIEVKVRESWRLKLIVKVKSGNARIDFATIDPAHAPAVTAIEGGGTATVLAVPIGGRFELARTDFKRVTPYDERFQVLIGPLKAIDF